MEAETAGHLLQASSFSLVTPIPSLFPADPGTAWDFLRPARIACLPEHHGVQGTMGPQVISASRGRSQLSCPALPSLAPASLPLPARPAANNEGVGTDNSRQLPHPGIAAVSSEDSRNPKTSSHRGGEELRTRSSYFMSQKSKETRLDLLVFEKH